MWRKFSKVRIEAQAVSRGTKKSCANFVTIGFRSVPHGTQRTLDTEQCAWNSRRRLFHVEQSHTPSCRYAVLRLFDGLADVVPRGTLDAIRNSRLNFDKTSRV